MLGRFAGFPESIDDRIEHLTHLVHESWNRGVRTDGVAVATGGTGSFEYELDFLVQLVGSIVARAVKADAEQALAEFKQQSADSSVWHEGDAGCKT